jgi:hypothetical protein
VPLIVDLYQRHNPVTDFRALARAVAAAYIKYSDGTGGTSTPADNYAARCREAWPCPTAATTLPSPATR